MHKRKLTMLSLVCLGLVLSQPGVAAEPNGWQYEVTPYLLGAALDGTVGVRGVTTELDASFGDSFDNLDAGFMGYFTASKGPLMFGLEGVYMKLESDPVTAVVGPGGVASVDGELDVTNRMYVGQATVGYSVLDDRTRLTLFGAVRWTKLDADMSIKVQFDPAIVFPGGSTSASGDESWTDGVIGALVVLPLTDHLALTGYADVGAGGSDLTYQFMGGVNWAFAEDFTAKVGYRFSIGTTRTTAWSGTSRPAASTWG